MELSLIGLFFLVRDSSGRAACTQQAVIMIFTMIFTALFHLFMDYGDRLSWRTLLVSCCYRKTKRDVPREIWISRKQISNSAIKIDYEKVPAMDVIWIPEDEKGVAANEIYHTSRFSEHLVASKKGAYLDKDGSIVLQSGPPGLQ
jgi:hypothetical protein